MTRRAALSIHTALALGIVSLACGTKAAVTAVTEEQRAAERAAFKFKAGALPVDTLATDAPHGDKMPVDHIILIMQENRSFDSYYSKLQMPGLDVAALDATNPDAQGAPVSRFHQTSYCFRDTAHGWNPTHAEWNDGKMDGFVKANDPEGNRAMGYFDETDIPYYYALAKTFSISDKHFCSVLGPTWPNRMFYFTGTSFGLNTNVLPPAADPSGNPYPNIFTRLAAANVSWKVYAQGLPTPAILTATYADYIDRFVPQDQYFADLANGTLPSVAFIDNAISPGSNGSDEHPPADMQVGQLANSKLIAALMKSSAWARSVLFITYDEHGGLYDHVAPPAAVPPDDIVSSLVAEPLKFDHLGIRVPLLAVSPYAKRGHVTHHVTDHTSITRFVEARFDLPALTARDANAEPPFDMFDFAHPDTSIPVLPDAVINSAELRRCMQLFPSPPKNIRVASGDEQTAVIGHAYPAPLVVHVVDMSANSLPGIKVHFEATTAGASVSQEDVDSEDDGSARVTLTAGPVAGPQKFTVTVDGVTAPLTVELPATAQ